MALGNNIIALMGVRASKEVAPAAWVRMWARSFALKGKFEKVEDEALTGSRVAEPGFIGSVAYTGEIAETLNRSSLKLLEVAGFTASIDATKKYYKLENDVTGWADFIKYHTDTKLKEFYEKARINSINLEIANRSFIGITWGIEALEGRRTLNVANLTEVPTGYVASEKVKSLDTVIKVNGTDKSAAVKSMGVTINNNLDTENYGFGSKFRKDLDVNDSCSIEFEATITYDNANSEYDTYMTALENNTSIVLEVVLGGVTLKLANCSLKDVSAPVSSKGKIELSISGTCHNSGVTEAVIFEHLIA